MPKAFIFRDGEGTEESALQTGYRLVCFLGLLRWEPQPLAGGSHFEKIPTQNRRWSSSLTRTQGASCLFGLTSFNFSPTTPDAQKSGLPQFPLIFCYLCWKVSSLGNQSPSGLMIYFFKKMRKWRGNPGSQDCEIHRSKSYTIGYSVGSVVRR